MFNKITFLLILITFATYAASGYLQNEDFKTEAELITAGGSKSQLLNDTKVYVTGNGINKTLDDAIIDGDIGAGGGDAGINFIVDASFEKETFAPTVSVAGGTVTYPTFTTNDKLYSEFNTKYYQIAHTGLSAANYSVNYSQARTGLDGKQGLFSIWAKVNADLDLCIEIDASGNCESTVSLIADSTWRKYEIPFVFGASSVEFKIFNASLTGNITLQLDKVYIGVIPDGYIQDVGQASFVGSQFSSVANCSWQNVGYTVANIYEVFPVDADCTYSNTGNILPPDTNIPAFKIPNARIDGYYKISAYAPFDSAAAGTICQFSLTSTSAFDNQQAAQANTDNSKIINSIEGNFRFNSSGEKTIQIISANNNTGGTCRVFADAVRNRNLTFLVHFFPDDNSTIVSQNTELTAQTANEFSVGVLSVGTTERENFDWINGNCVKSGTGDQTGTCTFVSGLFSATPNCACTVRGGSSNNGTCNIENSVTTKDQIVYHTHLNDVATSSGVELKCSRSTDYNKSATIIGKFENIDSSELCQIEARGNSNDIVTTLTEDIPFNDIFRESGCIGAWNNSGNTGSLANDAFVAPKSALYLVNFNIFGSYATNTGLIEYAVNGARIRATGNDEGLTAGLVRRRNGSFQVYLNEGDVLTLRNAGGDLTLSSSTFSHWIQITELPDTASIIKNLSQEKTKCQTKYLGSNVNATGTSDNSSGSYIAALDDIEFNNLTIGKRYRIYFSGLLTPSSDLSIGVEIKHNGTIVANQFCGNNVGVSQCKATSIGDFYANTTSLIFETQGFSTASQVLYGNGAANYTSAMLCELPSTYVTTDEW